MSLLLAPLLAAPALAEAPLLPADTVVETLDNGLSVVLVPLDTPGLVSVQTWMDVGARDEVVPGTTGYAHFFEHLMFEGSARLPREPRQQRLLELAVDENAWTSEDFTVYHSLAPAGSLFDLLDVEADRFARLQLDEAAVKREAGAVQGEWRKSRASPDSAAWAALLDAAFRVHPYRHPVIGFDEDVAAMPEGTDRVREFFQAHYRPDRATLVVAGDIDPPEVLAHVTRVVHVGDQGVACDVDGRDRGTVLGDVDAGLGLDRGLLGPAARHPVAVEGLPGHELDVTQPLGGRDVPVQAGDDQAGGEPVLPRERLAVHADRDQGVAAVEDR